MYGKSGLLCLQTLWQMNTKTSVTALTLDTNTRRSALVDLRRNQHRRNNWHDQVRFTFWVNISRTLTAINRRLDLGIDVERAPVVAPRLKCVTWRQ